IGSARMQEVVLQIDHDKAEPRDVVDTCRHAACTNIDFPMRTWPFPGLMVRSRALRPIHIDSLVRGVSNHGPPHPSRRAPRNFEFSESAFVGALLSDCVRCQACCHDFWSRSMALRMVRILRATAMRATIFGLPEASRRW